ncbi:uncharacterized protein Pyn_21154 [Prunus yedoensis var. nudiflora]|uniref:Agglutinin domain-containing protein n=1 Tax=Prunus yedoensis var. nudiflora TaxID=2094558 RepID=A0A314YXM8_PRUYE|nr:uncharacterized protein Pyn_21153 [Prunus yedoensis var. nudiflora]PQQ12945.1 uncharacterized protein Pyn_21154 [Prunus yedoensis var. nudiflora]
MASSLPQIFVLKPITNNKYLRYINQSMGEVKDILQFCGNDIMSIYSRFEKETAAPDNPDLVHIKCSYNNNYLSRAKQEDSLIVAGASQKQQQPNLWTCTLFKPELVHQEPENYKGIVGQFRFSHVQLEKNIGPSAGVFREVLSADDQNTVFTVINWEKLVTLPRHLAFKGNNGKFLSAQTMDPEHTYLEFSISNNSNYPTVQNEIFNIGDGSVRIKSTSTGNLWRRNSSPNNDTDNCICADTLTDDNTTDDTLFWPVLIEKTNIHGNLVVALLNLGENKFCRRLTTDNGVKDYLNAASERVTPEAHLEVIKKPDPLQT